jgi:iron complex outermembrane receptor protein
VIKEEAENAGERNTFGIEYRGKFQFGNFIAGADDITGYLYYTYTKTKSSVSYDHDLGLWVGKGIESCEQINAEVNPGYNACADMDVELGDIAPHKINLGFNMPISEHWNLNLRANWVSSKKLYVRNPLRAKGRDNDPYTVFDANLIYNFEPFSIAFKVRNLFDQEYYHSGVEGAESGDDFTKRSVGWRNSLIPQPGRSFMLRFSMNF